MRLIATQGNKAVTRARRVGSNKPIRNVIDGRNGPFPQVWSKLIAFDDNKSDLAMLLSEIIVKKVQIYRIM